MSKGNILYIRSGPYELSFDGYNLQEVGLGKAFCKAGFNFDIIYYTKKSNRDQIIETPQNRLRILWRKGIKLLRSGIYPQVLKKSFLLSYNAVIVSEYSQIMSVLVANRHPNTYIYNGPYYNLFKIPQIEKIYDRLFCKYINNRVKKVFCKTHMANDYLIKKGITNGIVVGVGLDPDKFETEKDVMPETKKLINQMEGKRNLLYVGQIIPRKNIELLIKSFLIAKNTDKDLQLVLVGSGKEEFKEKCKKIIPEEDKCSVIWCPFIKNAQLKFIYEKAIAFLLPSIQEIFGMVLLEAMYFGLPVISSHSAGADTLIEDGKNGFIVEDFEPGVWAEYISRILMEEDYKKEIGLLAKRTITTNFMWESIAKRMIEYIDRNEQKSE